MDDLLTCFDFVACLEVRGVHGVEPFRASQMTTKECEQDSTIIERTGMGLGTMSLTIGAPLFIPKSFERELKAVAVWFSSCLRCIPRLVMAQVRCLGCNRKFSPRGLTQHHSKTQDPRCHSRSIVPQFLSVSATIPWAAFSVGPSGPGPQEDSIGPPEPVDAMDADVFDSGAGVTPARCYGKY